MNGIATGLFAVGCLVGVVLVTFAVTVLFERGPRLLRRSWEKIKR